MVRALLTALVCLTLGCSGTSDMQLLSEQINPTDYGDKLVVEPVFVTSDLAPEMVLVVKQAIAEWNGALQGGHEYRYMGVIPAEERDQYVDKFDKDNSGLIVGPGDCGSPYAIACAGVPGSEIAIQQPKITDKQVLVHEMGHTMGMWHLPTRTSIMYPDVSGSKCIDLTTLFYVAALHPDWPHGQWHPTCEYPNVN